MRRNIDAWWPEIESGCEAILVTASGCGTLVKDYGELLAHDPDYAAGGAGCGAGARSGRDSGAGGSERARLARSRDAGSPSMRPAPCNMVSGSNRWSNPSWNVSALCRRRFRTPSLLRLSRNLFHHPAGLSTRLRANKVAALESGRARDHRHRQYRLSAPSGRRGTNARRALARIARRGGGDSRLTGRCCGFSRIGRKCG
jgi:glycolate oxidase iron-sulfur subunit